MTDRRAATGPQRWNDDPLLTRKEAAEYLGLRPQTLAAWACTGRYRDLMPIKVGSRAMYRKSALEAFIRRRTLQGPAASRPPQASDL